MRNRKAEAIPTLVGPGRWHSTAALAATLERIGADDCEQLLADLQRVPSPSRVTVALAELLWRQLNPQSQT